MRDPGEVMLESRAASSKAVKMQAGALSQGLHQPLLHYPYTHTHTQVLTLNSPPAVFAFHYCCECSFIPQMSCNGLGLGAFLRDCRYPLKVM